MLAQSWESQFCLSVTRLFRDKTKEHTANILTPCHASFLTPTEVGGRCPFHLKFALKVTNPPPL